MRGNSIQWGTGVMVRGAAFPTLQRVYPGRPCGRLRRFDKFSSLTEPLRHLRLVAIPGRHSRGKFVHGGPLCFTSEAEANTRDKQKRVTGKSGPVMRVWCVNDFPSVAKERRISPLSSLSRLTVISQTVAHWMIHNLLFTLYKHCLPPPYYSFFILCKNGKYGSLKYW